MSPVEEEGKKKARPRLWWLIVLAMGFIFACAILLISHTVLSWLYLWLTK